ncbi:FecR family protein [Pedobacter metabolipauper]|uniref:FecR family protein n=1 Tax=Pedobacter metabolipauper TaxID=425513 RepID=A0A4R6SXI9_9SPHI|nr:FecR domain-containing protein [Pedobacter metabolipauper]TDQ08892.1 FecR family protein [Pedobacter metabolipauper]
MQPEKPSLEELLNKHHDGKATPEEELLLRKWVRQLNFPADQQVEDRIGQLMKHQIDRANGKGAPARIVRLMQPLRYIAAAILLILTCGGYYFISRYQPDTGNAAAIAGRVTVNFKRLLNNSGKIQEVRLADGSVVKLKSGSTLLWQVPFASDSRKVELTGKAFFNVAKNRHKPFVVFSGDITTTALGTSFWIEQQENNREIDVRLITGKVVIKKQSFHKIYTLAYLTPGQSLNYQVNTGLAKVRNQEKRIPSPNLLKAVQRELLVFDNTSLDEVFEKIQAYYQVNIEFNREEVSSMAFYGSYSETDDPERILKTIAIANNLVLKKDHQTFIISK